ncbi:MAG: hypothetical protein OEU94_17380 [Aquincola sp.]|nr:hypothetical protein [Aquincola sp.]MDH4290031.1 hypothetical protein [Aquincola sp.]MDH5329079.1 hypothetical protein [Aquincola sp.]
MLTTFTDAAVASMPRADATLEPLIEAIEERLRALGLALRDGDTSGIDAHSSELHRALATAVARFAHVAHQPGGIPHALRQRLIAASGQVAAQRESLARATAALDRAIDVLMPERADGASYAAHGGVHRPSRGDFIGA